MDVFFYEAFAEEAEALKRLMPSSISCEYSWKTIRETGHADPVSRIVSIRTQSVVPASWVGKIGGVLSRSTGYDHLKAFRACVSQDVPCGYLDEYATRAVAEHAMMMAMALLRRLPVQQGQFLRFERDGLTGSECLGRRLLVVGVGRVGSEIVRLSRAVGMEVRGVDIVHRHKDVDYVTPEEGLRWADAIVCAMNLTDENRGYFGVERMRLARPGVVFVNIARGEHAPLSDLRHLVRSGYLGGLGLDVFENEPEVAGALRDPSLPRSPEADIVRELLTFPNVLFTPHNAFNTHEAVERKAAFTVTQVRHFLKHGDFLWKV